VRHHGSMSVSLIEVGSDESFDGYTISDFFAGFSDPSRRPSPAQLLSGTEPLLKLRDWPSEAGFKDLLPAHFDDLMCALPFPMYTRLDGRRNLASFLPDVAVPPDLGPKCYCAYGAFKKSATLNAHGRQAGTTNLHVDMADAVNLLVYIDDAASGVDGRRDVHIEGEKIEPSHGAVWHIFSQADTKALEGLLPRVVRDVGTREDSQSLLSSTHPLLDSVIYLDETLLRHLYQVAGIIPYMLLQRVGDAVIIPAGCAHQVFNIRSCIKVAADFVAPEHISHCVRIAEELRQLPATHHRHPDVLNVRSILFHTGCACLIALEEAKRAQDDAIDQSVDSSVSEVFSDRQLLPAANV